MKILKVFLETTIFNYYFDKERDAHPSTVELFEEIGKGKYQAFTSIYVIKELGDAPDEKRDLMLSLIDRYKIKILDESDEIEALAKTYTNEGTIPRKFITDAIHIATATVNDLDIIISLNFKHIVKRKTIELAEVINIREGYKNVRIYTPMEVVDYDHEET